MRVAILGASHWHVDLYYIPALRAAGAEIIAIHDPDAGAAERRARDLDCPHYTDHRELLDKEAPDLVFAHAPHAHMTELAADLIARHQPFHMEKPMGVQWTELDALAVKARTEGVWTSVALVSRYYGMVEALRDLRESEQLGAPCHYYHCLFAGSPLRYREWGVAWMLDPRLAGAGALWNFGPHIIDLFLYLVDDEIAEVQCWTSSAVHHLEIDDLATIRLTGASGIVGLGEVGYTMPTGYERFFSLSTDTLHCGGTEMGSGVVVLRDGSELPFDGPDSDTVYDVYVRDTLRRFEAGEPAKATIQDMARTLRVMGAARDSARTAEAIPIRAPGD